LFQQSPGFRGAAGMQIYFSCFCSVTPDALAMESYLHNVNQSPVSSPHKNMQQLFQREVLWLGKP